MNGYVVVARHNTQRGDVKGQPVKRDGHFKVYGSRKSAQRRSWVVGTAWTEVKPINYEVTS